MNIIEVEIDNLFVSDTNVRKTLTSDDDESTIEELANNIKVNGLINPITIKVNYNTNNNCEYEIIAGQRRYLACKLIGLKSITCNLLDIGDLKAEEISLVENVQRNQMTNSDKIKSYNKLYNIYNKDIKKVCNVINISEKTLKRYIKMSELPEEIINLLDVKGPYKITLDTAVSLTKLNLSIDKQEFMNKIKNMSSVNQSEVINKCVKLNLNDIDKVDEIVEDNILKSNNIKLAPSTQYINYNNNFYNIPYEMSEEIYNLLKNKYDVDKLLCDK